MDDLEICKRIADVEGVHYVETKGDVRFIGLISQNDFTGTPPELIGAYNPLTDDALCFQLMVKYKVDVEFFTDCVSGYVGGSCKGESINESPNKAICLAIIEAHKDNS